MDKKTIEEKKEKYLAELSRLSQINIEEEAEKRLADEKARIIHDIEVEVTADMLKCKHYLELIDELEEEEVKESTPAEPVVETVIDETTGETVEIPHYTEEV